MKKLLSFRKPKRIDIDSTESNQKGFAGLFETALRKFRVVMHIMALMPLYALGGLVMGVAATPGVLLFRFVNDQIGNWNMWAQDVAFGVSIALGYFLYGYSLLFIVPFINFVLGMGLKAWRGPYYSNQTLKWYIHNGLTYLVRFTFLEFMTPTPFNILFFKMMGMKIGDGVTINSAHISDPSLITIGEKATIGGSAVIVGHYGQRGFLVLEPVVIGARSTIGLRAIVMGGANIGEGAVVMANSVVLPKTVIPAGETWGGVPAVMIHPNKKAA